MEFDFLNLQILFCLISMIPFSKGNYTKNLKVQHSCKFSQRTSANKITVHRTKNMRWFELCSVTASSKLHSLPLGIIATVNLHLISTWSTGAFLQCGLHISEGETLGIVKKSRIHAESQSNRRRVRVCPRMNK